MLKKRILIVEDERIVAQQLQETLTNAAYQVTGLAYSGEDALNQARETRPDLVVMDIVLPGAVDGIDTARQLRSLGIPVIYLTAYLDRRLLDRAQHTEPLAYVLKPAKSGELAAVIQLALFKLEQEKAREQEALDRLAASREADEQFRLMVAGVTDYAIFTLEAGGNVNSWNRGAERLNGYSSQQILGQPYSLLFTPEDQRENVPETELAEARQHGSADDTRWLVRRNGELYWAEGMLTATRDASGSLTGFTKIVRDATEHKQVQDALRKSEERLHIALRAARMGTWHWDIRTNTETLDDSLRGLFGLAPDKEVNTIEDFYALLHPEDRSRVQAAFDQARRESIHLNTEFRVIRPDGAERWLIDQGEVVSGWDGQPAYLTGACVDITERKQVEEALQRSEERFRLFVNNVRDYALFQMDGEGRIQSWNAGAEHVLGYTAEDIIGQPSARIFVPEDVAAGEPQREIREAAATGRAEDERWHLRKDGTRFWCSGVLTAVRDEQGRLRGFAKIMRDETERRKANDRLQASLKEKEILLKEIHHRVKNNLQVITSLLALQADAVENQPAREVFEEACNRVRSIGDIHELLYRSPDFSRIDFAAYLDRLAHNLRSFYGVHPDRIRLKIASNVNLPVSEAIPCGLIVNELLTNALKHGFPGGKSGNIETSLHCGGKDCVLEVSDNGIGLPGGFKFEDGTSIGLKLVSVLAEQLKGRVHVHRRSEGTRISVVFPPNRNANSLSQ